MLLTAPLLKALQESDCPARVSKAWSLVDCEIANLALMYGRRQYSRNEEFQQGKFNCKFDAFEDSTPRVVIDLKELGV